MLKKYENRCNLAGEIIQKAREDKCLSKAEVCRKLQFYAVQLDPQQLYRIETNRMVLKNFELIALCQVLDIDANSLKDHLIKS